MKYETNSYRAVLMSAGFLCGNKGDVHIPRTVGGIKVTCAF